MTFRPTINMIQKSALWAAFGDALGFITELVNEKGLRNRIGSAQVHDIVPWKKQVDGRYGVLVDLPAGCYSDDTQLRLSVSRAINTDGVFDVEAFAKVELPLWLSYQLGAGLGTRAAAASLAKKNSFWATNFFRDRAIDYLTCGGNGAAMRIQPHVWTLPPGGKIRSLIRDIVRNSITTHGHPRGILGAIFHGLCLHYVLEQDALPSINALQSILNILRQTCDIVMEDDSLSMSWLPLWEAKTAVKFIDACETTIREMESDLTNATPLVESGNLSVYPEIVLKLNALSNEHRGSGTKTALLASLLCLIANNDIEKALLVAANTLGSDTDSIATMTGALMGCKADSLPTGTIMDKEYITKETERLYRIREGRARQEFVYPDLLYWNSPENPIDSITIVDNRPIFSAFGEIKPIKRAKEYTRKGSYTSVWTWYQLNFEQSVLIKHRETFRHATDQPLGQTGHYRLVTQPKTRLAEELRPQRQIHQVGIEEAITRVIESGFSAHVIGETILMLIDQEAGEETIGKFTSTLSRERQRVNATNTRKL